MLFRRRGGIRKRHSVLELFGQIYMNVLSEVRFPCWGASCPLEPQVTAEWMLLMGCGRGSFDSSGV